MPISNVPGFSAASCLACAKYKEHHRLMQLRMLDLLKVDPEENQIGLSLFAEDIVTGLPNGSTVSHLT